MSVANLNMPPAANTPPSAKEAGEEQVFDNILSLDKAETKENAQAASKHFVLVETTKIGKSVQSLFMPTTKTAFLKMLAMYPSSSVFRVSVRELSAGQHGVFLYGPN